MSFTKDFTQQQIYLIYTKYFSYILIPINIMVIRLCDSRPHQAFEQSEKIKNKIVLFNSYRVFDNFGGCT